MSRDQSIEVEVYSGMDFWDEHGDGNIIHARGTGGGHSLIKRFEMFVPELVELGQTFAMLLDREVVGLAGCMPDFMDERKVVLSYINVDESFRGQGYGTKLCQRVVRHLADDGVQQIECAGNAKNWLRLLFPALLRECETKGIALKNMSEQNRITS